MAVDRSLPFYMKIPLGDGTFTSGHVDYTGHPAMLGLGGVDLRGARVLDIAANDGFWTFWAEGRGSQDVVAIDVEGFDDYDWGYGGPPSDGRDGLVGLDISKQWDDPARRFAAIRDHLGSSAKRLMLSVYDLDPRLHGAFDLVFNYGLVYHLRHPLLSLDRVRAVTSGALVLETHTVNTFQRLPAYFFYEGDQYREPTNWTGPTEAAVAAWLVSAGFPNIWVRRPRGDVPSGRTIFSAALTDRWCETFDAAPSLIHLDEHYFDTLTATTLRFIGEDSDGD